jgi:tetratricopeptide (TPR) repeat protein
VQKALNLDNRNVEILLGHAVALTDIGKYSEADSIFQLLIEIDSLNPRVYSDYGYLCNLKRKPDLAEKYHKKAVELDPENYVSLFDFAMFYAMNGRFQEALIQIEKALELAPEHLSLRHGLGNILFTLEDLEGALETYESINRIDSTQAHVIRNLGSCYFLKGDFERAIYYLKKAIEYNPDYYLYYGQLGWIYHEIQDYQNAKSNLKKAISLARERDQFISMAHYFSLLGLKDSSYYYVNKNSANQEPNEYHPNDALGMCYMYLIFGEKDRALDYLESALIRGWGWLEVKHLFIFEDLRSDPEFQAFLARADSLKP